MTYQQIENKSRLYGSIGSTAVCAVLFLLLIFIYLPRIEEHVPEGILVSFGDSFDGGGTGGDYGGSAGGGADEGGYATPQGEQQPIQAAQTQPVTGGQEAIATQDFDEAAVVIQQQAERAAAAERQRVADAAAAEAARIAAENKKKQDAIDRANKMGGALAGSTEAAKGQGTGFGTGSGTGNASGNGTGNGTGTGTGVGSGSGSGRQGLPSGLGNYNGSWSLTGRQLVGNLARPAYTKNVEGKITVLIRVDTAGDVISTSVGSPTTISDKDMRDAAMAAAKKAHFTTGSNVAQGSITYTFVLN